MLDLKSEKSIILGLGDLKLSDTEYTLENDKIINGIHYKPIFPILSWKDFEFYAPYERLLANIVDGDGKGGAEISKGEETLFYGYGANRLSSNASNIVLGILDEKYSYFIKEWFASSTIYMEEPELIQREIIRISRWKIEKANYKFFLTLDIYSKNLQIKKEAFDYWKILEPKLVEFQDAFKEEQLEQLRLKRRR